MLPAMKLSGRVVIVTGAQRGIGRALALAAAAEGAKGVAVADLDQAGADRTVKEIEDAGGKAIGVAADVSREADVDALVARTEEAFGPVDVFFANAGVAVGTDPVATDDAT